LVTSKPPAATRRQPQRWAISLPDEEEHETAPIEKKAIISVDGKDVEECHLGKPSNRAA